MTKKNTSKSSWGSEQKTLFILSVLFVVVVGTAWIYSIQIRKSILTTNSVTQVDAGPLIEVAKIRNLMDSMFANSRSFFLLGSANLFDQQKKDKETFKKALATFGEQHSLPNIPEVIESINSIVQQEQDIFDQAMKFREEKTESKIVGQFYQSKVTPIRNNIGQALDKIEQSHNEELNRMRERGNARARDAAFTPDVLIPRSMIYFITALSLLFASIALLVIRLLAQRTRQVAERERLYKEAQKAIQARDEVIAAVSNDLREPLSSIKEIATRKGDTEVITSSVVVIEEILKNIYDQAKADMGSMALRLDQLSVDVILEDARLTLQGPAKQRDVRLMFDSASPHTLAFCDRERVTRILSNLVGNAIKFSPKNGKVMVRVRSDQQFVYISVEDSGPGIPEGKLNGIFENFWQASATAEKGAGVGLAIVKTIVEAHGGTVKVESRVGTGSTFTFSLPRRRPVGAQINRPAPIVKSSTRSDTEAPNATVS